jgi:hypothetical protein
MSSSALPPIPQRVAAGAALLDRHEPRWWRQVDPDRLDLADPALDVLGQLYGQFEVGLAILGEPDPVAGGFDLDASDADADYPALTAAWQQAIRQRRAADAPGAAAPGPARPVPGQPTGDHEPPR